MKTGFVISLFKVKFSFGSHLKALDGSNNETQSLKDKSNKIRKRKRDATQQKMKSSQI